MCFFCLVLAMSFYASAYSSSNSSSSCSSSSSSSSSRKIVYLSVTSQIYTNKTYSKTKDIRDPA